MIIPGSTSQRLAAELAATTAHDLAGVSYESFPDGEQCVQIEDDPAHAVVVAATTSAEAHVELLLLQDAARAAGAERVTTVIPYMGYARQDTVFAPGQPLSARAMARAVATGTDRVLTVTPHEPEVCDHFDVPTMAVSGERVLADALPADLTDPLFLAPDEGAVGQATTVRDAYGNGATDYFEKTRHGGDEVEITPSDAPVADRDVVLVDDIVATGSTMSESIAHLQAEGPARVFVACVHALLVGEACNRLARAGVEAVLGTDTIERPESAVSVAPVVADALE
jgi:ribose-phosphate pyrophosphokinase